MYIRQYYCDYAGRSYFQESLAEVFWGKVSRSPQLPDGKEMKKGKGRKEGRRAGEEWKWEEREEGKETNVKVK